MKLRDLFSPPRPAAPAVRRAASSLERLEDRIAPANVVATLSGHTLKVVGHDGNDSVFITGDILDFTRFSVTHTETTGDETEVFTGVTSIVVKMGGGDNDYLSVTTPNFLDGKLKISGSARTNFISLGGFIDGDVSIANGAGENTVKMTNSEVRGNLSIANGAGTDMAELTNLKVRGNVTVKNGAGGSEMLIQRNSAGESYIRGNLTVSSAAGVDDFRLLDTHVGGNVTVSKGATDANGEEGSFYIYNVVNTAKRLVIGGNVTLSEVGELGGVSDGIWDADIVGNVSLTYTKGSVRLESDGLVNDEPVRIHGNLTVKAGGSLAFKVGGHFQRGLIVDKAVTMTSGSTGMDTLTFDKLQVGGATNLKLGDGNSQVTVDDSVFTGAFNLTTGKDVDKFDVETKAGTALPSIFRGAVLVKQGAGADQSKYQGINDAFQRIEFYRDFIVHYGENAGGSSLAAGTPYSPFGKLLLVIP